MGTELLLHERNTPADVVQNYQPHISSVITEHNDKLCLNPLWWATFLLQILTSHHLYLSEVGPLKISCRSVSWFLTTRTTMVSWSDRGTPALPWVVRATAASHPSTTRPTTTPTPSPTTTTPSRTSLMVKQWQMTSMRRTRRSLATVGSRMVAGQWSSAAPVRPGSTWPAPRCGEVRSRRPGTAGTAGSPQPRVQREERNLGRGNLSWGPNSSPLLLSFWQKTNEDCEVHPGLLISESWRTRCRHLLIVSRIQYSLKSHFQNELVRPDSETDILPTNTNHGPTSDIIILQDWLIDINKHWTCDCWTNYIIKCIFQLYIKTRLETPRFGVGGICWWLPSCLKLTLR